MIIINIPGRGELKLKNLVLDYNGTIAEDGRVFDSIKDDLCVISSELDIYVLTADTHGNAAVELSDLPVKLMTFSEGPAAPEKERIVRELGGDTCISMGNGRNDVEMFAASAVSVGILGSEGMYGKLFNEADLVVRSIEEGLALIKNPKRMIAGLRW